MKIDQRVYSVSEGWKSFTKNDLSEDSDLTVIFGSGNLLKSKILSELRSHFQTNAVIGCSTAGEIQGAKVTDEHLVLTSVKFDSSCAKCRTINLSPAVSCKQAGFDLIAGFDPVGLKHVFVLSEGLNVNGSLLVEGMKQALPKGVNVTGGLAGDSDRFQETLIVNQDFIAQPGIVSAVGFYGDNLVFGYGSMGGWDSFGTERLVTKSKDNILFELDNTPALELYKSYLGDEADNLPASGLLFPLSMRTEVDRKPVVRTILGINEKQQSLTFAGNIPEGSYVRLMKANLDRIIDGAHVAAEKTLEPLKDIFPDLAIMINCVGRKLILKQMVEEEVDAVRAVFNNVPVTTGFYSYGEISPFSNEASCELHNQTMTITALKEIQ